MDLRLYLRYRIFYGGDILISFICSIVEDTDDQRFIIDLYHRYKKLMLMTARKYVADENGCEDIMQDSIVKLIQNIHVIRAKERCVLASYIVSTVRNTSIDYLRRQGRDSKYRNSGEEYSFQEPVDMTSISIEELLLMKERQAHLYDIWPKLSEQDQTALRGKYILEYSDAEIAMLLGCKEASVRTRLSRARKRAFYLLSQSEGVGE